MDGYDEAIVLDQHGHVSEGSAANIFMLRDGQLVTPPVSSNILEGITRRTIIEMAAAELNIEVQSEIDRTYVCGSLFFCGTGVQVAAITAVDRRPISGRHGPHHHRPPRPLFRRRARPRHTARHWNTPVL